MVFELHIWGPAFGLPSIEAECLATVAYLRHVLPPQNQEGGGGGEAEWVLIASSDPLVGPTNELPALKSGSRWVSGFRNIVDYLRQYSAGEWDLDQALDPLQRADCVAFSSFVESRGQPLLDLSLYVSSENYTTCTRAALAEILPWPNKWIVPPKLRAAAKKRSDHLGLSSLDINAAQDVKGDDQSKPVGQIPKSLLKRQNETVSEILGKSTHRSQFRLDAVTSEFLEPLGDLLGGKEWLLSDTISSLDCLAMGYLALMQSPAVPHEWLKSALKHKNPQLGKWTDRKSEALFGRAITVSDAMRRRPSDDVKHTNSDLPWQAPLQPTLRGIGASVVEGVLDSIPIVNEYRANRKLKAESEDGERDSGERQQLARHASYRNRELASQIVAAGAGIGAFVGYMVWIGVIELPDWRKRDEPSDRDFGEAGALLGIS